MELGEVKYNLGKPVRLRLPRHYIDGEYLLTGCILRKKSTGEFFYQAELTDMMSGALVIASLDDISAIGFPTVEENCVDKEGGLTNASKTAYRTVAKV